MNNSDCIFCKIVRREIPAERIFENEDFFVIPDINPVSKGHCLIISKKHYETIFDLPSVLGEELIQIAQQQGKRLIREGKADGIKLVQNNYEASGQIVKHFHLHIIPEKTGVKREKHV